MSFLKLIFIAFNLNAGEAIFIAKKADIQQFIYASQVEEKNGRYIIDECQTNFQYIVLKNDYYINKLPDTCLQVSGQLQLNLIELLVISNQFSNLKIYFNNKIIRNYEIENLMQKKNVTFEIISSNKFFIEAITSPSSDSLIVNKLITKNRASIRLKNPSDAGSITKNNSLVLPFKDYWNRFLLLVNSP